MNGTDLSGVEKNKTVIVAEISRNIVLVYISCFCCYICSPFRVGLF